MSHARGSAAPTAASAAAADVLILELRDVTKTFPGVTALDGVSFGVRQGEIHAIAGENGAGKSTLVKILAGAQPVDRGDIRFQGRPVRLRSPRDAIALGINTIHQELHLAPHLSAAENIFLGRFPLTAARLVDRRRLFEESQALIDRLGVVFDVRSRVGALSIAQRQIVEIARSLVLKSTLLILDEPSAVLGRHDLESLFAVLQTLKAGGTTILYISHRLEELFDIADRVTVLRDGRYVATTDVDQLDMDTLIEMMTGRRVDSMSPQRGASVGELALEVTGLTRQGTIRDINLQVRRGEIVALVGKVGSGRTEVARAIFGADPPDHGEVKVSGRAVRLSSPREAVAAGIGLVPEDRKGQGLLLGRSIVENITLANLRRFVRALTIDLRAEARAAGSLRDALGIRTSSLRHAVRSLSGGNQQKVVLAKWLNSNCEILIFDEPTRGIDVGAKAEIYRLMERLIAEGKAILMISSEASEILGLADRILVMRNGEVAAALSREQVGGNWARIQTLMEG